jgi:HSP20 family protein
VRFATVDRIFVKARSPGDIPTTVDDEVTALPRDRHHIRPGQEDHFSVLTHRLVLARRGVEAGAAERSQRRESAAPWSGPRRATSLAGCLLSGSRQQKGGTTMSLIRWEPFRALRRRDDVFDELFREVFRGRPMPMLEEGELMEPAVDVAESDGEVIVKMEVPGVEKDQLHLTVADDRLTVRGETRKESEEKRKNYYRQEIRYGSFQRSIALPVEVDPAKAHAELKNGMLKIEDAGDQGRGELSPGRRFGS